MDNIKIVKQTLYTQWVDQTTGELFEETREFLDDTIKVPKKTTTRTRKPKTDDEPTPMIHLLEGKVQLNTKAVELTQFEPEMKIDIQFEKKGRTVCPVMMQKDSGNRLTKTFTISCRGSKHDNLAEYGDTFEVIPYDGKEGYFKLKGNAPQKEDDIIDIPEEINVPEEDDLIEDTESIDISDFDLSL